MTMGTFMYYGGMIGVGVSLLSLLICLKAFPRKRRKMLEKLSEE